MDLNLILNLLNTICVLITTYIVVVEHVKEKNHM